MFGTVTRYFNDKGYGFICGQNKKSYFFINRICMESTQQKDIAYSLPLITIVKEIWQRT